MKRFLSIILSIMMALSCTVTVPYAENKPYVTADGTSGHPGENVYVLIRAEEFVDIGSMDLDIYYDQNVLSFVYMSEVDILSWTDHLTDINSETAGAIRTSTVFTSGISGSGILFELCLHIKEEAAEGSTRIVISIGDVYDISLNPVAMSSSDTYIDVSKNEHTTMPFDIHSNDAMVRKGDTFSLDLWTDSSYGMAACDFIIEYDSSKLRYQSVTLGSQLLKAEGASYSTFDKNGYIKISYICLKGIEGYVYPLLSVSFTAVTDETETTDVKFTAESVYDAELNPLNGSAYTSHVSFIQEEENLLMHITCEPDEDDNMVVTIKVPGKSNLAAADFILSYEPYYVKCLKVNKLVPSGSITSNIKSDIGEVKFSYVNTDGGLTEDTDLVSIIFKPSYDRCAEVVFPFVVKNPVDDDLNKLDFDVDRIWFIMHNYQYQGIQWREDHSAYAQFVCVECWNEMQRECTVDVQTTDASCTQPGTARYTATVRFAGETYSDTKTITGEVIPHKYEYKGITWREDNTAHATFRCSVCGQVADVECNVAIKESTATCTEAGNTVYTASVEFEGKTYTDTKTVTGKPLGHDYEVTWQWSADHTSVKALFVCKHDATHTFTTDGEVTVEKQGSRTVYTAKVTFEGKEYTDQYIEMNNEVVRIYGDNRYETSLKTAEELRSVLGVDKFDAVVLTTGSDFADALSGSYLANKNKAPVILIRDNAKKTPYLDNVINYIKEHVKSNGKVYVLGGEAAVPEEWLTGLTGYKITRLEGSNRYTTNIEVLNKVGYTGGDILVCTGKDFADSLSASAVDLPILLVNGTGSLSKTQKAYLESLSNVKFHIIGGEAAVSKDIETALASYGTVAERIAGGARYETSKLIAERFFSEPDKAVLAYGHNFPDGLGGGALAYALKSPLILAGSSKSRSRYAIEYCTGKGITSGYVLGGNTLISDDYVRQIFNLPANSVITEK